MKKYFKYLLILFFLSFPLAFIFAQYGGEAPTISDVKISEIDENSAVVEWVTDIKSDATVNYGLNEDYGIIRYPYYDKNNHKMKIDNLEPLTTYYFRVVSSDEFGNKSTSAGFVFTTKGLENISGIEEIKSVNEQNLVEKIISNLDQIKDPKAVKLISGKVQEIAQKIILPPMIIGAPKVEAETDYAQISWTTDRESNSVVYFASQDDYNPSSENPYNFSQESIEGPTKEHNIKIIGLKPSTIYHFKVVSEDETGLLGESKDEIFRTKSILPKITNLRVIKVQETSAIIGWTTDVPAEGIVEFINLKRGDKRSSGDPSFTTSHTVQLSNLEFGTEYSAVVKSKNEAGDEIISEPFSFVTVKDEAAPIISKVSNESTLFPGAETKIQTIISWETDEPALCQVFYTQGLVGEEGSESLEAESNPVTSHVNVFVGFSPSTVYRFWIECADLSNNSSKTENFVLFTPAKEKSIIDIILENFEGTFGWLKNIGK